MHFIHKPFAPSSILLIFTLILGSYYLFAGSMDLYPAQVHAWTQSDRLALAQNFQLNGFDFFHPATYNLLTKDGITQVDFPIHDYTVALIGELFNLNLVSTFRWYNLIYSLIGIYFFFQLCLSITKSPIRAYFAGCFLSTIPFYVYYQNGFLPSAPSFANFLIGCYFIFGIYRNKHTKSYAIGVFFLCLAALARSSFFIYLFALFIWQFWKQIKGKNMKPGSWLFPLLGMGVFIAYFLYNRHLGETYGSMFLGEWLYFESFDQFSSIFKQALNRWGKQLLSPYHAILLLILLIAAIRQIGQRRFLMKNLIPLFEFILISGLGSLLFIFAFGRQYADHDYYYIDSILTLFSLFLVVLLGGVTIPKRWFAPMGTLCLIFFFYFFSYAKKNQALRYETNYSSETIFRYNIYRNACKDFKKWNIKPDQDTLLIIDAASTNLPFTLWRTRGYTNLNTGKKALSGILDSSFTYAVLIDSLFRKEVFHDYPEIMQRLDLVAGNGSISLYQKSQTKEPRQFFKDLHYYGYTDFDLEKNIQDSLAYPWTKVEKGDPEHGNHLFIEEKDEFPFTVRLKPKNKEWDHRKPTYVLLTADYNQADSTHLQLAASSENYYHAKYLINELEMIGDWESKLLQFTIPPGKLKGEEELSIYFWNPEKESIKLDNLKVICYQ